MSNEGNSTPLGDIPAVDNGPTEADLLDAVMQNSPIMDTLDVPLPAGEIPEVDPEEVDEADPEESTEAESLDETTDESNEQEEVVNDAPEGATEDSNYTVDDLDLDAKLTVKIDGEEATVSFGDLVKGYTTEQSLSKKGRELGEARKALVEERQQKLSQIDQIAVASGRILTGAEENFARQYHDVEAQIEKARKDGDTYELGELKDKREQAQKRYWNARNQKEQLMTAVDTQKKEYQSQQWNEQIDMFSKAIPDMIPDFDEKVAADIRAFALEEGIAEGLLDSVVDPNVVKFIDDFRRLKQGVSKGAAKRKAAPAKKALPTKKAQSTSKKKATAEAARKKKAFDANSSPDDQMAFLRDYASKSLSNIK